MRLPVPLVLALSVALAGCPGGTAPPLKPGDALGAAPPAKPKASSGPGVAATPLQVTANALTGRVLGPTGLLVRTHAAQMVAAGAGNMVAAGAGNMVAAGAGNMVAAGAGNMVAAGAGNLIGLDGGSLITDGGSTLVAAGAGNLITDGGSTLVGQTGATLIGLDGGSLITDGGSTMVAAGAGNFVLAQVPGLLDPTPKATVELVDAAGKALAPPVETDEKGVYRLALPAGAPAVAIVRVRYKSGDRMVGLAAAAKLSGGRADVTPATTVVAKKLQVMSAAGQVQLAGVDITAVYECANALAPNMTPRGVAAAVLFDEGGAATAFDLMMGAAPKTRAAVAAVSARSKIPFVVGQPDLGNGGLATATALGLPTSVAFDPLERGAFFVVDRGQGRVRRVSPVGTISTVLEGLHLPEVVAVGPDGALYVGDAGNHRILRVAPDGRSAPFGGFPASGPEALDRPAGLAIADGSLFVSDRGTGRLWRVVLATGEAVPLPLAVSPQGLAVVKGTLYVIEKGNTEGGAAVRTWRAGDQALGTLALAGDDGGLRQPNGAFAAPDGRTLYVADAGNHRVVAIALDGAAGGPAPFRTVVGRRGEVGRGAVPGPADAIRLSSPTGVALAPDGRLVVADSGNGVVRAPGPDGIYRVVAGQASEGASKRTLEMNGPLIALRDPAGDLLISDAGAGVLRKLGADGKLQVVAGDDRRAGEAESSGDGGPAALATFKNVAGLAFDREGRLLLTDTGGTGSIRRIAKDGTISTVATDFDPPGTLVVDSQGAIYVSEASRNLVTRIAPDGTRSVVVGERGPAGQASDGDGGPAARAHVSFPTGLAIDAQDNLYVCELKGQRIRKIALSQPERPISTLIADAGLGPFGVAFDAQGRPIVVDYLGSVVRRFEPDGTATILAGVGGRAFSGTGVDDGLSKPTCVVVDPDGALWIVDSGNNQVKYVPADRL